MNRFSDYKGSEFMDIISQLVDEVREIKRKLGEMARLPNEVNILNMNLESLRVEMLNKIGILENKFKTLETAQKEMSNKIALLESEMKRIDKANRNAYSSINEKLENRLEKLSNDLSGKIAELRIEQKEVKVDLNARKRWEEESAKKTDDLNNSIKDLRNMIGEEFQILDKKISDLEKRLDKVEKAKEDAYRNMMSFMHDHIKLFEKRWKYNAPQALSPGQQSSIGISGFDIE